MRNYYELLGLDPFMNYRSLEKELLHEEFRCDMVINNSQSDEMVFKAKKRRNMIKEFESVLKSYGSKKNYDRALKISGKFNYMKKNLKVKVGNIDKKKKFKIFVAGLVVAGTITSGAILATNNLTVTEVPIYSDDSIEKVLEDYDIDSFQLLGKDKIGNYTDSDAKIIHTKKDEDRINKVSNERMEEHIPKKTYSFKYVVKLGDTVSGLENVFEATDIKHKGGLLYEDEVVTVYTTNEKIAEAGQRQFKKDTGIKELSSYEEYVVRKGDTLPSIAEKYNVSVDEILKYNPNIKDVQMIYEWDTIIIPIEYKIENEQSSIKK